MKKIFAFILSTCLLAVLGISLSSCPPSAPMEVDTTRLISAPSSLSLTAKDSSQSAKIALTCGCNFEPLVVTGYGGDTVNIHFSFDELLTADTNQHSIRAKIYPSKLKSPGSANAWIALDFQDRSAGGSLLFDTIRVSASY